MWFEDSPLEEVVNESLNFCQKDSRVYKLRPETPKNAKNHFERNLDPPR